MFKEQPWEKKYCDKKRLKNIMIIFWTTFSCQQVQTYIVSPKQYFLLKYQIWYAEKTSYGYIF